MKEKLSLDKFPKVVSHMYGLKKKRINFESLQGQNLDRPRFKRVASLNALAKVHVLYENDSSKTTDHYVYRDKVLEKKNESNIKKVQTTFRFKNKIKQRNNPRILETSLKCKKQNVLQVEGQVFNTKTCKRMAKLNARAILAASSSPLYTCREKKIKQQIREEVKISGDEEKKILQEGYVENHCNKQLVNNDNLCTATSKIEVGIFQQTSTPEKETNQAKIFEKVSEKAVSREIQECVEDKHKECNLSEAVITDIGNRTIDNAGSNSSLVLATHVGVTESQISATSKDISSFSLNSEVEEDLGVAYSKPSEPEGPRYCPSPQILTSKTCNSSSFETDASYSKNLNIFPSNSPLSAEDNTHTENEPEISVVCVVSKHHSARTLRTDCQSQTKKESAKKNHENTLNSPNSEHTAAVSYFNEKHSECYQPAGPLIQPIRDSHLIHRPIPHHPHQPHLDTLPEECCRQKQALASYICEPSTHISKPLALEHGKHQPLQYYGSSSISRCFDQDLMHRDFFVSPQKSNFSNCLLSRIPQNYCAHKHSGDNFSYANDYSSQKRMPLSTSYQEDITPFFSRSFCPVRFAMNDIPDHCFSFNLGPYGVQSASSPKHLSYSCNAPIIISSPHTQFSQQSVCSPLSKNISKIHTCTHRGNTTPVTSYSSSQHGVFPTSNHYINHSVDHVTENRDHTVHSFSKNMHNDKSCTSADQTVFNISSDFHVKQEHSSRFYPNHNTLAKISHNK
ncbi:uncharacterized protein LOC143251826 isoform X2 [Tachypleus tridentatus]|uniref:uncharacterized protein LOC143251826 isoform X1 n=1 Tax=Tachypleus tridentatus TaxID=6853 RepID=UPI003FD017A7